MNHLPVMLAHGVGRGGAVGLVILVGFVIVVVAMLCLDRSERSAKKD